MKNLRAIIFKEADRKSSQLGPAAVVVQKVTQELNNPNSSAKSIEKVIQFDQAFSARVLRMANSAFYGYGGKISTISQAIVILGVNTLKALLMAAAANRIMNQQLKGYQLKEGEFWEHSVLSAVAAREIAQRCRYQNIEEVFTGAVLHDLGKIFMDPYVQEEGGALYQMVSEKHLRLDECEMQLFGVHHGLVGQRVARAWNFPKVFQDVMAYHHEPKLSPQYHQVCAMVCLSSSFAWSLQREEIPHIPMPPEEETLLARESLSLSEAAFRDLEQVIKARWKDAQGFFR